MYHVFTLLYEGILVGTVKHTKILFTQLQMLKIVILSLIILV